MSDFASSVYEETSKLGKMQSFIGLIFATIVGIVLLIIGYTFVNSNNEYIDVSGEIITVNCQDIEEHQKTKNGKEKIKKKCVLTIKYSDNDNNSYTNKLTTDDKNYSQGQIIKIEYLKSEPNQIRTPGFSDSTIGYISSGISLIIIIGAGINYYFASNSKLYASTQGVKSAYELIK
jgi:uncharacterized membrane protein (UPF0136 family)